MFTNQLHNQCLSRGIYPNGVRQLFSKCDGRWSPNQFGTLGHCRTGRLRQTEALKLSTNCKNFCVCILDQKCILKHVSYIWSRKFKYCIRYFRVYYVMEKSRFSIFDAYFYYVLVHTYLPLERFYHVCQKTVIADPISTVWYLLSDTNFEILPLIFISGCLPNLLFTCKSSVIWKCPGKMVPRSPASLSKRAHHSGRNQIRFARR